MHQGGLDDDDLMFELQTSNHPHPVLNQLQTLVKAKAEGNELQR